MQDDRRIRLPKSYWDAEEQKKRETADALETRFDMPGDVPDDAPLYDATSYDTPPAQGFSDAFAPQRAVFLPEIPDELAPPQDAYDVRAAHPGALLGAAAYGDADDPADPAAPQVLHIELPTSHTAAPAPHGAYDYVADGFVPQGSLPPRAPRPNAPLRRTLPLVDDTLPLVDDTLPAQAVYQPRHAAPQGGKARRQPPAQTPREPGSAQQGSHHKRVPSSIDNTDSAAYDLAHDTAGTPPPSPVEPAAPKAARRTEKRKQSGPAQDADKPAKHGKSGKSGPKKKKRRLLKKLAGLAVCFALLCLGGLALYLNVATQNDFLWLDLAQLPHRAATVLYAQDGSEYARLEATQQKTWVDLADVPLNLQHAFVAIEDQKFYEHNGVSVTRTLYAVLNEIKKALTGTYFGGEDGIKQGASTITQQLVKNLTYDNEAGGIEGYFRKLREIYRAYKLDADYEKDEIMQAYLNVIGFTGNTAGVQAESVKLFNKTVDALTLEQCASIAAITKNPYRYDPVRNPETHLTRRNYILYEMWQQGYIAEDAYNAASAQPIGLEPGVVNVPKTPVTSYFTDKLIEDVSDDLAKEFGLSRAETTNLLYNGGLRIYTTVDANLQAVMEQNMRNNGQFFPQPGIPATVPARDAQGNAVLDEAGNPVLQQGTETPQAAMVSVGYDGSLKAVVGGLGDKDISRGFNRGTDAVRQVGSTMKPIGAYALAVEKNKIHWSTAVMDAPVRKIEDAATGELRDWPANFTKTYSNQPLLVADAMAESINTVAVRVGERAGVRSIYNFTRSKLDITSFSREDAAAGPMILGSSTYGVTPYELAGAYMMFGNGGTFSTLHCYTDVQTGYGRSIVTPAVQTKQVISPDTAYVMNRLLREVMRGTGTAAGYAVQGDMESIGKTGTTSDNRDYWFVGLTPYTVTAAWYGYDSGAALNTSLGTHAPTNAWRAVMQQAQRGLAYQEFPVDETVTAEQYCSESGGLATAACPRPRTGYYRAAKRPATCILHRA